MEPEVTDIAGQRFGKHFPETRNTLYSSGRTVERGVFYTTRVVTNTQYLVKGRFRETLQLVRLKILDLTHEP
jgi:hypothetical protein